MTMEIVLAAVVGAHLGRCQRCGGVFLYGLMTGRRDTAKFCGHSCRNLDWRKHQKEGRNVSAKKKMESVKRT